MYGAMTSSNSCVVMSSLTVDEEQSSLQTSRRVKRSTITARHLAASKLHPAIYGNVAEWDGPSFQTRRELSGILAIWHAVLVTHE